MAPNTSSLESIVDMTIGSEGDFWVAYSQHLERFDGKNWIVYKDDLPVGIIKFLTTMPNGKLWIFSSKSAYEFDGQNWNRVPFPGEVLSRLGQIILSPDGGFWGNTVEGEGVLHFMDSDWKNLNDMTHWQQYRAEDNSRLYVDLKSAAIASDGSLWVTRQDNFLMHLDHQGWHCYSNSKMSSESNFTDFTIVPNGDIWLKEYPHGLWHFDGKQWEAQKKLGEINLNSSSINISIVDGTIWAENGKTLIRFDGQELKTFTEESSGLTRNIAIDPGGTLWVGTQNGVAHFVNGKWISFEINEPPNSEKISIDYLAVASDGTVWAGTNEKTVYRFNGKNWTAYHPLDRFNFAADQIPVNQIQALEIAPDDTVWVGTECCGAFHFDGKDWINYTSTDGLGNHDVRSIAIAPDGTVWFVNRYSLSRYRP